MGDFKRLFNNLWINIGKTYSSDVTLEQTRFSERKANRIISELTDKLNEYQTLKEENEKLKESLKQVENILTKDYEDKEKQYTDEVLKNITLQQQRDELVEMLERVSKIAKHYLNEYHDIQENVDLGSNWDIEEVEQLLQKVKQ